MNYGEIIFDMAEDGIPTIAERKYLLKKWKRYSIYAKSGSHSRTDNPATNLYSSSSVYLYNYVVVTGTFFDNLVYSIPTVNGDPAAMGDYEAGHQWTHLPNTFKGTPNLTTNNYTLTGSAYAIAPGVYRYLYDKMVQSDTGEYLEIVGGYPRNHFTHKRSTFSLFNILSQKSNGGTTIVVPYRRCSQATDTTIGEDGLEDGSPPIQSTQVGNVNLIRGDNVINK